MKPSVSIFIPAWNEEKNIADAIDTVVGTIKPHVSEYELLVVDDGSTDRTANVITDKMKKNSRIRLIRHATNMSLGPSLIDAAKAATCTYFSVFPGDNDMKPDVFIPLLSMATEADIITCYLRSSRTRSYFRRCLSDTFVFLINLLFGMNLLYFNGPFICKTDKLRHLRLTSKGFTIYAEMKIRLIKNGASYKEIPFDHVGRSHGKSKALSFYNVLRTFQSVVYLLWNIQIKPMMSL